MKRAIRILLIGPIGAISIFAVILFSPLIWVLEWALNQGHQNHVRDVWSLWSELVV